MKLGTQTGSLNNHILSRAVIGQPNPIVGMGATILAWSDRHAATIVATSMDLASPIIWVREDHAIRTDKNGLSETQQYTYNFNAQGRLYTFRRSKSGMWDEVTLNPKTNRYSKTGGYGLRIGERDEYRDFSF